MSEDDLRYMRRALALAEARLGRTWPNPSVGCVVVKNGAVIGEGATGVGGRPHAEEVALDLAGDDAREGVAYITLEPCARRTAGGLSCTGRLIKAGVTRAVVAIGDPHPGTNGAGFAQLREAGIVVDVGLCDAEAREVNAGFINVVTTGLPMVREDANSERYDSVFNDPGEKDARAALKLLGQAGLTRLCVTPGSDLAKRLEREGLLTPPASKRSS